MFIGNVGMSFIGQQPMLIVELAMHACVYGV